jgi:DUF1009 family protein
MKKDKLCITGLKDSIARELSKFSTATWDIGNQIVTELNKDGWKVIDNQNKLHAATYQAKVLSPFTTIEGRKTKIKLAIYITKKKIVNSDISNPAIDKYGAAIEACMSQLLKRGWELYDDESVIKSYKGFNIYISVLEES